MNYFEIFEIPISLRIDKDALKRKYFKLSKTFHPDRFINEPQKEQDKALLRSSEINEAYKTLKDEYSRIEYLLRISDILSSENEQLDPVFLMEIMEINESMDTLSTSFDKSNFNKLNNEVEAYETQLRTMAYNVINQDIIELSDISSLELLKAYYLKMKYILRIKKNLLTFAVQ